MASTPFDAAGDRAAWHSLTALGWTALRVPEALGGSGASLVQLGSLIEAAGESLCALPLIGHAMAIELLLASPGSEACNQGLREAARGRLALAWGDPPAGDDHLQLLPAPNDGGWRLHGRIRVAHGAAQAGGLIACGRTPAAPSGPAEEVLVRLPAMATGLRATAGRALDGRPAADLLFDGVAVQAESVLARGEAARQAIERARDIGRLLVCVEACGMARRLLEMTIEHLKNRQQFGQPLAGFQVLQHRAADMLVAATYARDLAWETLARVSEADTESDVHAQRLGDLHHDVLATKLEVMRNVRFVAEQAIQLHGGMGVSDESPVSHAYRRVLVIDAMLGTRLALLHELGRDHRSAAVVPAGAACAGANPSPTADVS